MFLKLKKKKKYNTDDEWCVPSAWKGQHLIFWAAVRLSLYLPHWRELRGHTVEEESGLSLPTVGN